MPDRDEVHRGVEHRRGLGLAQLDGVAARAQPLDDARGKLLVAARAVVDDQAHPPRMMAQT
jgi:hypothetical protein